MEVCILFPTYLIWISGDGYLYFKETLYVILRPSTLWKDELI